TRAVRLRRPSHLLVTPVLLLWSVQLSTNASTSGSCLSTVTASNSIADAFRYESAALPARILLLRRIGKPRPRFHYMCSRRRPRRLDPRLLALLSRSVR